MGSACISILDVGHGNSAVLVEPCRTIIIDAGLGNSLLQFLKQENITRVNLVLISHADADHIGGLIGLLADGELEIDRIILNSDALKKSEIWEDVLWLLDDLHLADKISISFDLSASLGSSLSSDNLVVEVLAPSIYLTGRGAGAKYDVSGPRITANTMSAVIAVGNHEQRAVLFAGDIDRLGLTELKRTNDNLRAEVLIFPHHGGTSGLRSIQEFVSDLIDAVLPKTVIFSIGRGRHSTPNPEIVANVRALAPHIRIACTQLSEHCRASIPEASPTHLTDKFANGKESSHCCAGTIDVNVTSDRISVTPDVGHTQFVQVEVPNGMCRV